VRTGSTRRRRHRAASSTALERLQAARDRARATVTLPRTTLPRRWVVARSARPSVDPDDWTFHVAYAARREPWVFDRLVDRYSGFATATARRQYEHGEPVDDLVQVSHEALMLALRRFDPGRGTPFLAFAAPTITGTLRRHFRDAGWALRVPRHVHELATPQRDAVDMLTQDLGRPPVLAEVADFLGVPVAQLAAADAARHARSTTSIDAPSPGGDEPGGDLLGGLDGGMARAENRTALRRGLANLAESDLRLLTWYYFEDETQSRIAQRLGCSQMQVSRLLAQAIQRLRPFLSPNL